MARWVWWCLLTAGCMLPPDPVAVACYRDCARRKDACMLQASSARQVEGCDALGARCAEGCE